MEDSYGRPLTRSPSSSRICSCNVSKLGGNIKNLAFKPGTRDAYKMEAILN